MGSHPIWGPASTWVAQIRIHWWPSSAGSWTRQGGGQLVVLATGRNRPSLPLPRENGSRWLPLPPLSPFHPAISFFPSGGRKGEERKEDVSLTPGDPAGKRLDGTDHAALKSICISDPLLTHYSSAYELPVHTSVCHTCCTACLAGGAASIMQL